LKFRRYHESFSFLSHHSTSSSILSKSDFSSIERSWQRAYKPQCW